MLVRKTDPVLRAVAVKVNTEDPEFLEWVQDFANEMVSVMILENGVGLAAPQIGESFQIFVWQSPTTGVIRTAVNPTVMSRTAEQHIENEGCLSLPGESYGKWRSQGVRLSFFDPKHARYIVGDFQGYEARIVQHELDHLAGRLIDVGSF